MPGVNRVTVSAWVGSTNFGDELILFALISKIRARGVVGSVVSRRPRSTERAHSVHAVAHGDLLGIDRTVRSSRALLFGGGGLLQDETSPFNLPYHLSRTWLARMHHVPFAGIGLGAGRLDTRLGRTLVRRSLGSAVGVAVRDAPSRDVLVGLGLDPPVLAADLALSLPLPQVEGSDRLVVSLRPWTGQRSVIPVGVRPARRGVADWFVDAMAAALDEAADRTGLAVRFVALQADRDDEVHRAVAERMRTDASIAVPTLHEVVDEVAAGRVVVAMRYHAGIAAVLGGRPSVLVGYSPKVASLAGELGGGAVGLRWEPDDLAGLPDAVERVLSQDEAVVEARGRLRERERGNDLVLDRLLEVAARRSG